MYKQDWEYITFRRSLIPEADAYANEKQGKTWRGTGRSSEQWGAAWNLTFHSRMDQLVKERAAGHAAVSVEALEKQIAELTEENNKLRSELALVVQ